METNKPTFETGATSHTVNELILYTDNTRELAQKRDSIYQWVTSKYPPVMIDNVIDEVMAFNSFGRLLSKVRQEYIRELNDSQHVKRMTTEQETEYKEIYILKLKQWKLENK